MAECLVTKLNSVVNDDNLLKLGELRVRVDGSLAITSIFKSTSLRCITGTFEDSTTEKTVVGYASFSKMTNPSVVSIMPKYNLATISSGSGVYVDLRDLKACSELTSVNIKAIDSSFQDANEWMAAPNITRLTIYTNKGFKNSSVEDLSKFKAVKILELRSIGDRKISLNLENLPNLFPNLTTLVLYSVKIEGNLNELILPSTCTSCTIRYTPATLTGSKATFLANNPQVTTADFIGSHGITA